MEAKCLDAFHVGELIQLHVEIGGSAASVAGLFKAHFNS